MSSTQAIGNNAGTAVPLAVDGSGNLVAVSSGSAVTAPAHVYDGSGWVSLRANVGGEVKVVLVGTTSGGSLVPVQVATNGELVIV